eukprot:234992_1
MHAHSSDEYYNKEWVLSIDYLLALMIYCNFDRIGYEFSKSYREDDGKQHTEWFWMGKNLKIAIRKFGQYYYEHNQPLYHGITKQLIFPTYVTNVQIHGPLSTSSEIEVAITFTNGNQGLIIQFGDPYGFTKKFAVGWLSDFANEKEHLF